MTEKAHIYLRTALLLGFTFLIAFLLYSGNLYYYLAPRLHTLAYVTVGILALLSLFGIKQIFAGKAEDACECGGNHAYPKSFVRSLLVYTLFALPLIMGFCLPNKYLGSAVAEQKGVHLAGAGQNLVKVTTPASRPAEPPKPQNAVTVPPSKESVKDKIQVKPTSRDQQIRKMFIEKGFGDYYTDLATSMYKDRIIALYDKTFLDGLTILDLYMDEFNQHKLETYGFVYRDPSFSKDQFVVARFSVSCCTADATVAGILVTNKNAKKYPDDSWVKVKGTMHKVPFKGVDMLELEADEVTPVKAPKDPYVYLSSITPQPQSK